MTIGELIEKLQAYDPARPIGVATFFQCYFEDGNSYRDNLEYHEIIEIGDGPLGENDVQTLALWFHDPENGETPPEQPSRT